MVLVLPYFYQFPQSSLDVVTHSPIYIYMRGASFYDYPVDGVAGEVVLRRVRHATFAATILALLLLCSDLRCQSNLFEQFFIYLPSFSLLSSGPDSPLPSLSSRTTPSHQSAVLFLVSTLPIVIHVPLIDEPLSLCIVF